MLARGGAARPVRGLCRAVLVWSHRQESNLRTWSLSEAAAASAAPDSAAPVCASPPPICKGIMAANQVGEGHRAGACGLSGAKRLAPRAPNPLQPVPSGGELEYVRHRYTREGAASSSESPLQLLHRRTAASDRPPTAAVPTERCPAPGQFHSVMSERRATLRLAAVGRLSGGGKGRRAALQQLTAVQPQIPVNQPISKAGSDLACRCSLIPVAQSLGGITGERKRPVGCLARRRRA